VTKLSIQKVASTQSQNAPSTLKSDGETQTYVGSKNWKIRAEMHKIEDYAAKRQLQSKERKLYAKPAETSPTTNERIYFSGVNLSNGTPETTGSDHQQIYPWAHFNRPNTDTVTAKRGMA